VVEEEPVVVEVRARPPIGCASDDDDPAAWWLAAVSAALRPAIPAPTTTTSAWPPPSQMPNPSWWACCVSCACWSIMVVHLHLFDVRPRAAVTTRCTRQGRW
jgi:hypothetical protein